MASPITNCFDPDAALPRLPVDRAWVYRPELDWSYSHHASVTWFRGRYYAIWSNGRAHEDDVGQRVLMSTSEDLVSWSTPVPLIDSLPGKHSDVVLTAAGFHQHEGMLVAYAGQYEHALETLHDGVRDPHVRVHEDTCLKAVTTRDGERWTDPVDLGVPIVPNLPPQPTRSGRLIVAGNVMFPWSDDPAGLSGWTRTGIYPSSLGDDFADDPAGHKIARDHAGWPVGLCEGSFYQTDDGALHMPLRSGAGRLWLTESRDDGETWSEAEAIDFTDNGTKFHFGRLPDGRFYYVGCPHPEPRGARCPLVVSVSDDGVRFDRHFMLADEEYAMRCEGNAKGGQYGYPHTLVHDGRLITVVSRRKEAVEVLWVSLDAL